MYALGGATAVLLGAVMPDFLRHYDASYAFGGRVVFTQAVGFLLGVPVAARAATRYPARQVLAAAALMVGLAQTLLFFLPPVALIYPLAVANGMGASALETVVSFVVLEHLVGQRAIFMSRLEVSFGSGALILPAVAGGLIALGDWRGAFLVVAGMGFFLAGFWQTADIPHETVHEGPHQDAPMIPPPQFPGRWMKWTILALFLFMTFVYVGLEGSVNSFMPAIFAAGLQTPPDVAVFSASAFWAAMVVGRLAISWAARHLRYDHYLWATVSVTVVCLLVFPQLHHAIPGFVLLCGLGLGMAAIYSVVMVYANHTFPGMTRRITSLVTAVAGAGGAVFPALVGYAMDRFSAAHVLWGLFGLGAALWLALLTISGSAWIFRASRPTDRPPGRHLHPEH
jgi:FHS family glucose/mannose:H+ symporter-like MFS transporter